MRVTKCWLSGFVGSVLFVIFVMFGILGTLGCSTVSGTGRAQLMFISEQQERQLALQMWASQSQMHQLSARVQTSKVLQRVGKAIAASTDRPNFEWEFVLLESPQVNAFCLPGGKIGIYTGLLPLLQTEAGLAGIVGHEAAHAVARHMSERLSQAIAIQMATRILASAASQYLPVDFSGAAIDAFGMATELGVKLPFSRAHEDEADELGMLYMAMAGYDPNEIVAVWERMREYSERKGGKPPEFLSTHPSDKHRVDRLRGILPRAMMLYNSSLVQVKHGKGELKLE